MSLSVSNPRPLTPYAWCVAEKAVAGDTVLMIEPGIGRVATRFTIDQIDEEAKRVTWSLEGVWKGVEWREMDKRGTEYVLSKEGVKA